MKRSIAVAALAASLTLVLYSPPAFATFKGKNGRIAYAQDRGKGSEIYTMKPDGTDRRRLTQEGGAWFPSWSPDATKIVFQVNIPGEVCGSIELMNAEGSDVVDLTSASPRFEDACANGPSFTPDGRRIVFDGGESLPVDAIWTVNLQGGNARRIITAHRLARFAPVDRLLKSPRISPDGRTLLFEVEHFLRDGTTERGLFTVRMNGNDLRLIVPFSYDVSLRGGDWAPRGNRIVFSSNVDSTTDPQNVWTVRPDGSGFRQLTHFKGLPPDTGTGAGSYSPDGNWIMFKHVNADRFTLWKVRPDGTDLTRITRLRFYPTGAVEWGPRPRA